MFKKVKTEHHILKEFHKFLQKVETYEQVIRIIPGRIHRKQKKTSIVSLHFSYFTDSGMKFKMNKGSTSQELFVVCNNKDQIEVQELFITLFKNEVQ